MSKNTREFDQERESLLIFIWQKRMIIITVTIVAAIAATIVSFLLTPIFKSSAIVFPAATSTVSFSEQRNAKANSMDFGEEDQAEQLVQILQSSKIRTIIVNRYDLMNHYEIDSDDVNKNYKLGKAWENHINFTRTRYGSIQIDVFDEDRFLAAEIANKIVQIIDTVKNEMVQERTIPAFRINQRKINQLEIEKNEILKKMDSLSQLGVVSIEGRANLFSAYNESKNTTDRTFFKKQIDVNLQYGATFDGLEMIRDEKITKLTKFEDAYEQAESDANTLFNHKFIVEPAVVADKKAKPKRLIIILLATIGAFVFIIFALLINARVSELKKIA
ncbi:MAG: Wzz/FepE/Etk N-terminal domain-containing protein [Crocinitomicaceae bacterium]|nr:Wzz/FepE/Etk N-terminal domain-containing protein [Crocinitomicaceae bacterium]MDG1776309.1 Wzz/FepE/Etk N-terminal domain-containing protein [Crocinitomicaceae bacterium]